MRSAVCLMSDVENNDALKCNLWQRNAWIMSYIRHWVYVWAALGPVGYPTQKCILTKRKNHTSLLQMTWCRPTARCQFLPVTMSSLVTNLLHPQPDQQCCIVCWKKCTSHRVLVSLYHLNLPILVDSLPPWVNSLPVLATSLYRWILSGWSVRSTLIKSSRKPYRSSYHLAHKRDSCLHQIRFPRRG